MSGRFLEVQKAVSVKLQAMRLGLSLDTLRAALWDLVSVLCLPLADFGRVKRHLRSDLRLGLAGRHVE